MVYLKLALKMKKYLLNFIIVLSFFSCKKKDREATLVFNDIQQFPQEIIITQLSEDFVQQSDTIQISSKEDIQIKLEIDRPKYLYVQKNGETFQLFFKPGEHLGLEKRNDQYIFKGNLKRENSFLQEIKTSKDLKKKSWNYDLPFDKFKNQVAEYFSFKMNLLNEHFPEREKSYFYCLTLIEDQALKNSAILDHINTKAAQKDKDSLFFEYLNKDLLDFKNLEAYIEAGTLRSFWSQKGVEFFMRKKYGENLDSLRHKNEHYVLRGDIISEHFDQPLKSILIYNDLRYYPEEYEYAPDSLNLSSPRDVLKRYKKDLKEDVYITLMDALDKYEARKNIYATGSSVPNFNLRNESNHTFELRLSQSSKLVLIDVWASWCAPCIRSFPKVKKLEQQYSNQLEVVTISIDGNFDLYYEGLQKFEVPGELKLYAEKGFNSEFAKYFQITGIPRYIFLDQEGNIIDANLNFSDIEDILENHMNNELPG